jgi:hypothetical protein
MVFPGPKNRVKGGVPVSQPTTGHKDKINPKKKFT